MARRLCGEEHYPAPLLAVAGYLLPEVDRPQPSTPLGDELWQALLLAAHTHRVTGLLHAAATAGPFPVTTTQMKQLETLHRAAQVRVLALEGDLLAAVDLLAELEVPTRVLKGSAVARLDYPHRCLRSFIDVDLMVRADDFDRAVAALTRHGYLRTLAQPRPGFDRRFDKGTTLLCPSGFQLDLHRTLVLGPWGRLVDLEALWADHEDVVVSGRRVRALSRPHRFLHACYHATLGDWPLRLSSLRDVAQIGRALGPDVATVQELAARWGVEAVVAAAVTDSRRLLGINSSDSLYRWADRYVPGRREEDWIALHTHTDKTFAAQAVATVRVLPTWRDRAAYLRALALPDQEYTAGRHESAPRRFHYAAKEIRRGRSSRARDAGGAR